jgi:hypothetical protein
MRKNVKCLFLFLMEMFEFSFEEEEEEIEEKKFSIRHEFHLETYSECFNLEGDVILLSNEMKEQLKIFQEEKEVMVVHQKNVLFGVFSMEHRPLPKIKERLKMMNGVSVMIYNSKLTKKQLVELGMKSELILHEDVGYLSQSDVQSMAMDDLRMKFHSFKLLDHLESKELLLLVEIAQSLSLLVGFILAPPYLKEPSLCLKESNVAIAFPSDSQRYGEEIDPNVDVVITNNSLLSLFYYLSHY